MREIRGDLLSFTVDPTTFDLFQGFRCGKRGTRPEREVDAMVAQFYSGQRADSEIRVTLEIPPGGLVGLSGISGPVSIDHPRLRAYQNSAYVSIIGVSEPYRGARKDGSRPGDRLMGDALRQINRRWRGGMPWVLALVDPKNEVSRDLFERHGFEEIIEATAPDADAWFRRPKLLEPPAT